MNPQAQGRLILLVVDLGCLCGGETSQSLRECLQRFMGVITSRCEGISSLLYGMGYSREITHEINGIQ